MKIINFINPSENKEVYRLLVDCVFYGFGYPQTCKSLLDVGYFIPEDQFECFKNLCNIMVDLDIGHRCDEVPHETR